MSKPLLECPADKAPWRDTAEGPMPMVVPAEMLEASRQRYPKLWIEAFPPDFKLTGKAIMPSDVIKWSQRPA